MTIRPIIDKSTAPNLDLHRSAPSDESAGPNLDERRQAAMTHRRPPTSDDRHFPTNLTVDLPQAMIGPHGESTHMIQETSHENE